TVSPGRHRAMVDTLLAMEVFLALHERLQLVDLAILQDLAHLDAPRSWPLLGFFRQELRERTAHEGSYPGSARRGSLGDLFAAQLGMDPRVLSFALTREEEPVAPAALLLPGDVDAGELPPPEASAQNLEALVDVIKEELIEPAISPAQEESASAEPPRPFPRHVGYHTAYQAVQQALTDRTSLLM